MMPRAHRTGTRWVASTGRFVADFVAAVLRVEALGARAAFLLMRVIREPRREPVARRHAYSAAFKLQVVREALLRPASNRIKPTCRDHPGIEPVQLRKWIRNLSALEEAVPSAKCLSRSTRGSPHDRTSEEGYSSLDDSNIIDDCRHYANHCGGHFRVLQPTPLRPPFAGAKHATGEAIATQWYPTRDPHWQPQAAYEGASAWPNMLVVTTGSFGMPITVDGHFGQTAPPQHSQPILNIYAPVHACAQPQHATQNGCAPAAQAQAALSEIAKQQPLQRTPSGRGMSVPQAAGQTREPPSPLSGSDSAFNAVGPQLTKSNSFRAREEQTCAAQELMLLSLARPPAAPMRT